MRVMVPTKAKGRMQGQIWVQKRLSTWLSQEPRGSHRNLRLLTCRSSMNSQAEDTHKQENIKTQKQLKMAAWKTLWPYLSRRINTPFPLGIPSSDHFCRTPVYILYPILCPTFKFIPSLTSQSDHPYCQPPFTQAFVVSGPSDRDLQSSPPMSWSHVFV